MTTRVSIIASAALFSAGAIAAGSLAALYVAIGVHAVIYLLHAIEVKLNRLLDRENIYVSDEDVRR